MKTKAILIDAVNQKITQVEIEKGNLNDIYKRLGCSCFTVATYLENEDCVYVDDEGLLKPMEAFFEVKGGHQPFAGNGLVVGTNSEGDTVDVKTTVEDITKRVTFKTPLEVRLQYA